MSAYAQMYTPQHTHIYMHTPHTLKQAAVAHTQCSAYSMKTW